MSNIKIKTCVLGMVSTNCYIVYKDQDAVVIDPADNAAYILDQCRELGVTPSAILLTHGHFDHILAVDDLRRLLCIPVYAGEKEETLMQDAALNLSTTFGHGFASCADVWVKDGEELDFLGTAWKVIATPGHTTGSVCFYLEDEEILFSGDTLFWESLGRTDFPTGRSSEIIHSIREKLFLLPDGTMAYPGHGGVTTIGHEKRYNPAAHGRN